MPSRLPDPARRDPAVVVAIPARDEAERIAACLGGLAAQRPAPPDRVVLLLNNCTDATAATVRRVSPGLPFAVEAHEVVLPPGRAHAGGARALAMDLGAEAAGAGGVLLTSDADAVAPPSWLALNRAALAAGADAVLGRAVIDPADARLIPRALHDADARECAYAALLDELAYCLDPEPADPWPRHVENSGASIAVTVAAFRRVGGIDPVPLGEDRAFTRKLRAADCRVRHAPEVWVTVSGRIQGRAAGGMADTIRRRLVEPDRLLDESLEPAERAHRRFRARRAVRLAHAAGLVPEGLAAALCLPPGTFAAMLRAPGFGAAWAAIEAASPELARVRVPVEQLDFEVARAKSLLRRVRDAGPRLRIRAAAAD